MTTDPVELPPSLLEAMRIEGSELTIQMGGPHNLDWTYRVRYINGSTGIEITKTGDDDLQNLLDVVAFRYLRGDTTDPQQRELATLYGQLTQDERKQLHPSSLGRAFNTADVQQILSRRVHVGGEVGKVRD